MELRAEVYTRKQLGEAIENKSISKIYVPYTIVDKSLLHEQERLILIPPVYLADCEDKIMNSFMQLYEQGFRNALVHTVGHIELLKKIGFNMYGGHRLNCTNSDSLDFFFENEVKDIIVSPELTSYQINHLRKNGNIGFIAYGFLPLMITRRCPIKNGKPCNKEYCEKKIKDRMNNGLSIICSENTVEVLNSDVLYLADKLDNFSGADFMVLKFTTEHNIENIISDYKEQIKPSVKNYTRGLYFRGIKG